MPEVENIASLYAEIEELKTRLKETQETLDAIRNGEVDAIIVTGHNGDKVFSLTSSENPYRTIIEEMEEGAVTVSSKGIIFYSNHRFAELVSFQLEKVIGSDFADFVSDADKPEFKRLLRTALKRSVRGEVTSVIGNKTINLQLSLTPLPGNMEGDVCIMVSDITEISNYQNYLQEIVNERTEKLRTTNRQLSSELLKLKRTEKALHMSEERYSLAVTAASLGTWEQIYTGTEWKTMWSDQMYLIYGLNAGVTIDKDLLKKIIHPLDLERVKRDFAGMMLKKGPYDSEYRIMCPGNSVRWVHVTGKVTQTDDKGNLLRINGIARDITKRKESELRIMESEAKYRLLSDTMTQGVIYSDAEGKILSINPAGERIFGIKLEDILGKTAAMDFFQDDGSLIPANEHPLQKTLKTGRPTIGDNVLIYNAWQQIYRYINIDTIPLFNKEEKEPYQIYSVFEDITDQKLAEKEIRKREQLFRSAFDDGAVPMTITVKEGRFLKVNRAFCSLTGYNENELLGMSFPQITHPDDIEVSFVADENSDTHGKPSSTIEKRYIRKDGRIIWVNLSTATVRDESGVLFVSHIQDISKRKHAELRLKESREKYKQLANELEKSREKLSIALETAQVGAFEVNLITHKATWDERTERMFGIEPGSFGGRYDDFINCIHEEDVPHIRQTIDKAVESKNEFEIIFRTKPHTGFSNHLSTKAIIIRDKEGRPVGMSGVCFDVTSMKKGAEQALIKLNEELLRSNTDLQQFAYVASHDLQEPLRMVSSFTQLLQQRYADKLDADANEYIRFAVEGSKRMYDLLNGLLTYSRIQTRGKDFHLVDMNIVAAKVRDNLSLVIEEHNATVEVMELPVVFADENQMIQLIQNLFENSLKFRQNQPVITISAEKEDDAYVFSVKDNGIGIESQYFERIFKIFQRLHRSEQYGGTGIGLAICKRIVERHGGKIWIESKPDAGSTFYFSIPVRKQNIPGS